MKLILIGTGDFRATAPIASAGYIVQTTSTTIKLDFGQGNLLNMAKVGIDWRTFDAILISHIHPDHVSDLTQYLQALTVTNMLGEYDGNIDIYGPHGFKDYFDYYRKSVITQWEVIPEIHELHEEEFTIGDIHIKTLPMDHNIDCAGYRLEANGKTICYTGDTGPNDNLTELAQNADILLAECANDDSTNDPSLKHLSPKQIAELVTQAKVKKVVLTHYTTDQKVREQKRAAVAGACEAEVIAGQDLMEIQL